MALLKDNVAKGRNQGVGGGLLRNRRAVFPSWSFSQSQERGPMRAWEIGVELRRRKWQGKLAGKVVGRTRERGNGVKDKRTFPVQWKTVEK